MHIGQSWDGGRMHIGSTQDHTMDHTRVAAGLSLLSVVQMLSQPKCAFALWPEHKRQSQAAETQDFFPRNLFLGFLVVDSRSGFGPGGVLLI